MQILDIYQQVTKIEDDAGEILKTDTVPLFLESVR